MYIASTHSGISACCIMKTLCIDGNYSEHHYKVNIYNKTI